MYLWVSAAVMCHICCNLLWPSTGTRNQRILMTLWPTRTSKIVTTASMIQSLTSCWRGPQLCPDWTPQRTRPSPLSTLGDLEILFQMEILSKDFIKLTFLLMMKCQITSFLIKWTFACVSTGVTSTSLVKFEQLLLYKGSSVPSSSLPLGRQLKWLLKSPSTNLSLTDGGSQSSGEGKTPLSSHADPLRTTCCNLLVKYQLVFQEDECFNTFQ